MLHYLLTAVGSSVVTLVVHTFFGTTITKAITAELAKVKGEILAEIKAKL